ncbi:S41 family peptidase [Paracrocinitomix mangrovi]|uniref:S41 family peptidase n=1 Tax=Paracrocinitomix mangrovi TaxID=2862509 RepID=UPI001C8E006A|nr:S41 family peptidase [Paracrocinitomix mangrovi]UKN02275.1 S41 family peptidase [Paracrocinitomix mangrovi]
MNLTKLIIALMFPVVVSAQTTLTQKQIRDDYRIFKSILISVHPSFYEYNTIEDWDSIFNKVEKTELNHLKNADEFYRTLCSIANNVRDGHLMVYHSKMDTIPKMFPLMLKIIDSKLYTDTDEFNIPLCSEIISINGVSSSQLLDKMLKYVPADGNNLTKKYRQIEREFGILHYYEFGKFDQFEIEYLTPENQLTTTAVYSQVFEEIGDRYPLRNSHFALYHGYSDRNLYFQERINEKWPFYNFIDSINTAVITVNSFGLEPKEFNSRLIEIFMDFRKKKVKNLIVDVRQNNGGYRINAINLFSLLTNKPFKQRVSESVITSTLFEEEYIIDTLSNYDLFLTNYFANSIQENNRWVLKKDHAENELEPNKRRFKGHTYVLIGGRTFSAGSAFALNAKNDPNIALVGEETGGGYYFHTGQYPVLYQLPYSKIMLRISLVKIDHYVNDNTQPKGRGIIPDYNVNLSVEDLKKGKDTQLDFVINHIQNN